MGCVRQQAGSGPRPSGQLYGRALRIRALHHSQQMCGSGMKAVMLGYDQIKAGGADIIIAGGMESMSNAPYLSAKGARRRSYRASNSG